MERQCSAFKENGHRCRLLTESPTGVCHLHDPQRAEERRRRASRGGRSKASGEVRALRVELKEIRDRVDKGSLETTKANTMVRCISAEVDILRLERDIRVEDELAVEIREIKRERSQPA